MVIGKTKTVADMPSSLHAPQYLLNHRMQTTGDKMVDAQLVDALNPHRNAAPACALAPRLGHARL